MKIYNGSKFIMKLNILTTHYISHKYKALKSHDLSYIVLKCCISVIIIKIIKLSEENLEKLHD